MEPKPPTLRFLAYLIPCISFLVAACNQQALPPGPPPPAPPAKPLSADTHADDLNPHEDPRGSQLVVAAFNLDVERVDALLAEGVDPNSRMGRYDDLLFRDKWSLSYSHIGSDRWTPLMAVAHSHREG
jgi:hypothetical protein